MTFEQFFETDSLVAIRAYLGREPNQTEMILMKSVGWACWIEAMENAAKVCDSLTFEYGLKARKDESDFTAGLANGFLEAGNKIREAAQSSSSSP